ncbi:unnamed protein product [Microthlaspi erraticum]|uniref:Uncharacterized protein n=1 Tax=Microthlaspi erraticum TaxID=1685480 RepID=A0A6D2IK28_9BRAS|nr:unnamed protein product [Microthlaspi erraticum]
MPSGAKKRKALKKKQQQESSRTSTNNQGFNGDNLHGNGSQDDRESDSNLSSPGSQGNEEFGAKDQSAALSSAKELSGDENVTQGLSQKSGNGIAAAERGADDKKITVEKPVKSSSEKYTHTAKNVACQDPCGNSITEIAPVADSVKPVVFVSKVVIPEKSEHVEASTHSNMVKHKSVENKEYPSAESVRESEAPVSSEEKRILLPGPPAVRTSWLSCCGLFDAMSGSDR